MQQSATPPQGRRSVPGGCSDPRGSCPPARPPPCSCGFRAGLRPPPPRTGRLGLHLSWSSPTRGPDTVGIRWLRQAGAPRDRLASSILRKQRQFTPTAIFFLTSNTTSSSNSGVILLRHATSLSTMGNEGGRTWQLRCCGFYPARGGRKLHFPVCLAAHTSLPPSCSSSSRPAHWSRA